MHWTSHQKRAGVKRLDLLDYGRLVAALSVMAFHYFFNGIRNGKIESITAIPELAGLAVYGHLGVQFFFMISGYVIFFSAAGRRPSEFLVARAVRLFPAFWIAVLLTSACAMLWAGPAMTVSLPQILVNLSMVPALFDIAYVDGVYWTLQLELAFYGLVLLALLAGLGKRLETLVLLWPLAILAVALVDRSWLPLLGGYYVFFAAGAVLAVMREKRGFVPPLMTVLCAALCVTEAMRKARLVDWPGHSPSVVGVIILLMFVFFLVLNTRAGTALSLPGARLAGALTYPLYLVHAHIGYMLLSRFGNDANRSLVYPAVIATVLLCAFAVHWGERRLQPATRALFDRLLGRPLARIETALLRQPA